MKRSVQLLMKLPLNKNLRSYKITYFGVTLNLMNKMENSRSTIIHMKLWFYFFVNDQPSRLKLI